MKDGALLMRRPRRSHLVRMTLHGSYLQQFDMFVFEVIFLNHYFTWAFDQLSLGLDNRISWLGGRFEVRVAAMEAVEHGVIDTLRWLFIQVLVVGVQLVDEFEVLDVLLLLQREFEEEDFTFDFADLQVLFIWFQKA